MTDKEVAAVQADLVRAIEGPVGRIGDADYQETVTIDNGRINRKPYLVARPSSTIDVAAILKYCDTHEIRVTSKSGGHGAAGYCLNSGGIVIDLSLLNSIRPNESDSVLAVGMGTRWIDVYNHLQKGSLEYMAVGGGCGPVGLGGFLLGGGYSFISRSYGLGSDSVLAMEFVGSEGEICRIDGQTTSRHEADLYWALRGCGGGNFGIVTEVELELHRTPTPTMMMGLVTFPFDRLEELLPFYNNWVLDLPDPLAVYGMIRRFPDANGERQPSLSLRFSPIYNGSFSTGMASLRRLLEMNPLKVELFSMTVPQWENLVGNGTLINRRSAYIRSAIMARNSLTGVVAKICAKHMANAPSDDSYIVWTHAGGKIEEISSDSCSFAHRNGQFVFELKTIWDATRPEDARRNIEWAVEFFDELEEYSQGAYLNYIDPLLQRWSTKYYGESYERLLKIKSHWDPKGRFDFQQGIGSTYSPSRESPLDLSALLKT